MEGGDGASHVQADVNFRGLCWMGRRLEARLFDSEHRPAVVCCGNKCVILPFGCCLLHHTDGQRAMEGSCPDYVLCLEAVRGHFPTWLLKSCPHHHCSTHRN